MKLTSPLGPGAGQKAGGRSGRFRQLAWASVPLWSFGFFAFAPFLYVAVIRRRIRDWAVFAAYLAVVTLFFTYFAGPDGGRHPGAAGGLLVLFMGIAAVHAFIAFRPGSAPAPSRERHARTGPPGPGTQCRLAYFDHAAVLIFALARMGLASWMVAGPSWRVPCWPGFLTG